MNKFLTNHKKKIEGKKYLGRQQQKHLVKVGRKDWQQKHSTMM